MNQHYNRMNDSFDFQADPDVLYGNMNRPQKSGRLPVPTVFLSPCPQARHMLVVIREWGHRW